MLIFSHVMFVMPREPFFAPASTDMRNFVKYIIRSNWP